MKYKVIAEIRDGIICANKSSIICFVENSLQCRIDDNLNGEVGRGFKIGDDIPKYASDYAETYWSYSRKEWNKMNKAFQVMS